MFVQFWRNHYTLGTAWIKGVETNHQNVSGKEKDTEELSETPQGKARTLAAYRVDIVGQDSRRKSVCDARVLSKICSKVLDETVSL